MDLTPTHPFLSHSNNHYIHKQHLIAVRPAYRVTRTELTSLWPTSIHLRRSPASTCTTRRRRRGLLLAQPRHWYH